MPTMRDDNPENQPVPNRRERRGKGKSEAVTALPGRTLRSSHVPRRVAFRRTGG
ncbi:hypothetical protein [Saccharothrix violaceirubra]|uniref:Uncharacterized protein n=1 Tax=Saccharothrix violaceirubra TaxID=413306 RepID=A0A7W7T799_9PSEU|nr:hypothetical protein [Saccharothrix violaceirubra]MBB4967646.1 hypothetical protein [Saccharothrix violaceirubra]